jgi:hypothetical protein
MGSRFKKFLGRCLVPDIKENSTAADDSKSVIGSIHDYFLGGDPNFEIGGMLAERISKATPMRPELVRMRRWFMSETVSSPASKGCRTFLELAPGLPPHRPSSEYMSGVVLTNQ